MNNGIKSGENWRKKPPLLSKSHIDYQFVQVCEVYSDIVLSFFHTSNHFNVNHVHQKQDGIKKGQRETISFTKKQQLD